MEEICVSEFETRSKNLKLNEQKIWSFNELMLLLPSEMGEALLFSGTYIFQFAMTKI